MNIPKIEVEDDFYIYKFDEGQIWSKKYKRNIGFKIPKGYIQFGDTNDNGKKKLIHRILYEKYYGPIPDKLQVNHINGKKDDNRINNLELVTHQQNKQYSEKYKTNTSGEKNINLCKRSNKWRVEIQTNNKTNSYGRFEKIEDAIKKRDEVIKELNNKGHKHIIQFPN